jgi:dihydroorotate dehydrogenase
VELFVEILDVETVVVSCQAGAHAFSTDVWFGATEGLELPLDAIAVPRHYCCFESSEKLVDVGWSEAEEQKSVRHFAASSISKFQPRSISTTAPRPNSRQSSLKTSKDATMIQRHLLRGPLSLRFGPIVRPRAAINVQLRQASTVAAPSTRIRNFIYGSTFIVVVSLGYVYATDTRASIHRYVIPPLIAYLYPDAEDAHHTTTAMLKELYTMNLHPRERGTDDPSLAVQLLGHTLSNPMGISGGLDKHGDIPDALFALGPSIIELGGVTPLPQNGNPRPRVFRIPSEDAIVNRYGLPSEGADVLAMRLRQRVREFAYKTGFGIDEAAEQAVLDGEAGVPPGSLKAGRLLAVQIAKNKDTPDDIDAIVADHVYCAERLAKYADILVVNVSSPNTPGLRALQARSTLTSILSAVVDSAKASGRASRPLVMVKVSPDEDSPHQIQGIVDAVWASSVDGVIVGNTTKLRPEPSLNAALPANEAAALREQGGYSGPALFERTIVLVQAYRKMLDDGHEGTGEKKVVFASGGITDGKQAKQVLESGASVAMVYTGVVYGGAGTISRLKDELVAAKKSS